MSYISASDIYNYKIYDLSSTTLATSTVDEFIADAESVVNGKCASSYDVPFTSTAIPHLIKKITRDIAGYYILDYLHQQANRNMSSYVEKQYTASMSLLNEIYDGKIDLLYSLTTGGEAVLTSDTFSSPRGVIDTPLIVNMDSELDWAVPGNLLDTIETDRDSAS